MEKYKLIIKKKEIKHDKIVLLAKPKLNSIEVLISKASFKRLKYYSWWVCYNKCTKSIWRYERRNKKYKELISSSRILVYL